MFETVLNSNVTQSQKIQNIFISNETINIKQKPYPNKKQRYNNCDIDEKLKIRKIYLHIYVSYYAIQSDVTSFAENN